MSSFLPLFPLQLVVFPEERLNLHIFEPRYKQLIQECQEKANTFGIPAYIDGKVMEFGTEVKLLKIEKEYPNGEMDIRTQGVGIFKIEEFYRTAPGKLYSAAEVERVAFEQDKGDFILAEEIVEIIRELFTIFNVQKDIPEKAVDFHSYDWAHHIGLTLEQEYQLLRLNGETERQQFIKAHLEAILPKVKEVEAIRQKAQMNGHFKDIIPPNI